MKKTKQKAIRAKCIDCCCGQKAEVKLCEIKSCPLWWYRLGYELEEDENGNIKRKKRGQA